ncbi:MAG: right-handed parallel beta-helix repeat-containing protein [Candidatus Dependentiae bacterium]
MKKSNILFLASFICMNFLNATSRPKPGTPLWNIVASTQSIEVITESKLSEFSVDFSGIFTSLNEAQLKASTIESQLDVAISEADTVLSDFSGVFTSLDALNEKIDTVQSKTDVLDTSIFNIEGAFGIAIRNSDVGTTGLTITDPGTYFLAEHINYAPSGTGTAAITIDGDNITLDLNGRTIRQTNSMGTTVGVEIAAGHTNVQITGGTIRNFTAELIDVNSTSNGISITHMNCLDNGSSPGIELRSGIVGVNIDTVNILNAGNIGLRTFNVTDMQMNNCNVSDSSAAGIRLNESNNVSLFNCIVNNNNFAGLIVDGPSASTRIDSCTVVDNGTGGIRVIDAADDVLITNCFIGQNNSEGIEIGDSDRIKVIENYLSENTSQNIFLDGTTQNCYVFANCMVLSTSVNLLEASTAGPNSVLGNYALANAFADNYVTLSGNTTFNFDEFDQSGAFPSPAPTSWKNMSVRT